MAQQAHGDHLRLFPALFLAWTFCIGLGRRLRRLLPLLLSLPACSDSGETTAFGHGRASDINAANRDKAITWLVAAVWLLCLRLMRAAASSLCRRHAWFSPPACLCASTLAALLPFAEPSWVVRSMGKRSTVRLCSPSFCRLLRNRRRSPTCFVPLTNMSKAVQHQRFSVAIAFAGRTNL